MRRCVVRRTTSPATRPHASLPHTHAATHIALRFLHDQGAGRGGGEGGGEGQGQRCARGGRHCLSRGLDGNERAGWVHTRTGERVCACAESPRPAIGAENKQRMREAHYVARTTHFRFFALRPSTPLSHQHHAWCHQESFRQEGRSPCGWGQGQGQGERGVGGRAGREAAAAARTWKRPAAGAALSPRPDSPPALTHPHTTACHAFLFLRLGVGVRLGRGGWRADARCQGEQKSWRECWEGGTGARSVLWPACAPSTGREEATARRDLLLGRGRRTASEGGPAPTRRAAAAFRKMGRRRKSNRPPRRLHCRSPTAVPAHGRGEVPCFGRKQKGESGRAGEKARSSRAALRSG